MAPKNDPAFDVAGLPDPFTVYWPVFITNLYTAIIYVTSLLIAPPAGWTDSEQNLVSIAVGTHDRTEKSNSTRAVMATPANESVTVRYNYRTGSYAGPIIGFDDFSHAIYWENVTTGTIDDTDDFEVDLEGWSLTQVVGAGDTLARSTTAVVHGAYSAAYGLVTTGNQSYIQKALVIGAGTRAYLLGYIYFRTYGTRARVTIESPVESLELVCMAVNTWRRFGVRLNPGASNTVTIRGRAYWGGGQTVHLDYLRWVRY